MLTASEFMEAVIARVERDGHNCASIRESLARTISDADAFDVADALYWYGDHYNSGQWSREYALHCCVMMEGYNPSRMADGPEPGTVGEMMYQDLAADMEPRPTQPREEASQCDPMSDPSSDLSGRCEREPARAGPGMTRERLRV